MGVIITIPMAPGGAGSGVFSQSEKLALELEMEFKAAKLYYYKEFGYTGNELTVIDIYEDKTKAIQLFGKTLTYTDGKLTQIDLTRISDSATLTKKFTYTGSQLISIEVTV